MIFLLWCCVVFVFSYVNASHPNITPSEPDITLILNTNMKISCSHSVDIEWIVPKDADPSLYKISENTQNSNFERSISFIYNNSANPAQTLVGSYYCLLSKSKTSNNMSREDLNALYLEQQANRIFVYVKDAEIKLAGIDFESYFLSAALNSVVYFPCWPTEKNIPLKIYNDLESDGIEYELDPHLGAKFNVTERNHFDIGFSCEANDDNEHSISVIIEEIEPPEDVVIKMDNYGYAELNGSLRMTCSAKNDEDLIFSWTRPSKQLCKNESRILYITQLSKQDEGQYKCTATNPKIKTVAGSSNALLTVKFVDPFLRFEPYQKVEYTGKEHDNVEISLEYRGYPMDRNDTWKFPINIDHSRTSTETRKNVRSKTALLVIKDVQLSHNGNYTLLITSSRLSEPEYKTIKLTVTGDPRVTMNDTVVPSAGSKALTTCNVVAYPPPQAIFYFQQCDVNFECKLSETRIKDEFIYIKQNSKYNVTYTVNIEELQPGMLRCELIVNGTSKLNSTAKLYVMEKQEHFWLESPGDFVEGINQILSCFASKYHYTNSISWYFNENVLETQPGIILSNSSSKYMWNSNIELIKMNKLNDGVYTCKATQIEPFSNVVDQKEFTVSVKKAPSESSIVLIIIGGLFVILSLVLLFCFYRRERHVLRLLETHLTFVPCFRSKSVSDLNNDDHNVNFVAANENDTVRISANSHTLMLPNTVKASLARNESFADMSNEASDTRL